MNQKWLRNFPAEVLGLELLTVGFRTAARFEELGRKHGLTLRALDARESEGRFDVDSAEGLAILESCLGILADRFRVAGPTHRVTDTLSERPITRGILRSEENAVWRSCPRALKEIERAATNDRAQRDERHETLTPAPPGGTTGPRCAD